MEKYADLVNDDLEMELRRRVREVMKHHDMVDNVIEADLVAIVKPVAKEFQTAQPTVSDKLVWQKISNHGRDIFAKTPFGDYTISKDNELVGGTNYLWHPEQAPDADYFAEFKTEQAAKEMAERLYARLSLQPVFTGVKDKNGTYLFLGDHVRYKLEGSHTKPEYWNPEYEIIWNAPKFTLKYIGAGKDDAGNRDFILRAGGGNGDLELIKKGPHHRDM